MKSSNKIFLLDNWYVLKISINFQISSNNALHIGSRGRRYAVPSNVAATERPVKRCIPASIERQRSRTGCASVRKDRTIASILMFNGAAGSRSALRSSTAGDSFIGSTTLGRSWTPHRTQAQVSTRYRCVTIIIIGRLSKLH